MVIDSWSTGDPYEYFMGRWSSLVASSFTDWLSPSVGLKWLDMGCGSGALSQAIINKHNPACVIAVDQSEGFIETAKKRLGDHIDCRIGNALSLPLADSSVNVVVSGLVLNFISEPQKALEEMRRVTSQGGTVAVYIWDYPGKMEFLKYFWDAAVKLEPKAKDMHEGIRFLNFGVDRLKDLFCHSGFLEVEAVAIEISTHFKDFEDYWNPFLGGQGPAPTYLLSLNNSAREKLRNSLFKCLPILSDGSIPMVARAWAVRGAV